MTDREMAMLLCKVHRAIENMGDVPAQEFMRMHPEFDSVDTEYLLRIMVHYRVLVVIRSP
jgi:hypothetical protein